MAKPVVEAPQRWVNERAAGGEAELGQLFRAVAEPEPLSAPALAQVHARLGKPARYSTTAQRRLRELGLAAVMLLAGSSLALAGWGVSEWWSARAPSASPTRPRVAAPAHSSSKQAGQARTGGPEPAAPAMAAEPQAEASAPSAPSAPKGSADAALSRRNAPPATADSSALAAESQALERVLVKLRREHDAQGALSLLDQSQALFARGTLALEAQVARVDALLLLGRGVEALAILEHLPFSQVGRGGELRLVRAELRAAGDCGRALSDFDALVTQALSAPLLERALYGRAACELQVGDRSQAEHDLNAYLSRFPRGRFAARVQSQLSRLTRKAP